MPTARVPKHEAWKEKASLLFRWRTNDTDECLFFLTSAEGSSQFRFKLTYADGTVEQREIRQLDYCFDAPVGDPDFFSLATDLPKWNAAGRMQEANHHYLHGVDLHPDPSKEPVSVQVLKTAPRLSGLLGLNRCDSRLGHCDF